MGFEHVRQGCSHQRLRRTTVAQAREAPRTRQAKAIQVALFRVGMIGCGGIANRHATILQKLERTELVAFCDIAEERARDFNEKYADCRRRSG